MTYRKVEPDEILQSGDEWFDIDTGSWKPTTCEGDYPEGDLEYRRRVE